MFKRIIETLFIAVAYYLSGKLGQTMAIPPGNVTPVWPPSGIALALMLLIGPRRAILGLFIGAFAANLSFFDGAATSVAILKALGTGTGIALGSVLQPLVGLYLIQRFVDNADPFYRIKNFLTFIAIIPVMCLVSASFGTTSLAGGGFAPWAAYLDIWLTWWLGDSVGVLVAAPLLLAWWKNWRFQVTPLAIVETVAIFASLLLASWGTFASYTNAPLAFIPVPFLLWAALRLDLRGVTAAILTVEAIAIFNTLQNRGPFYSSDINESLLLLQLFISVFTITIVIVAIFVDERDRAQEALLEEHQNQLSNLVEGLGGKYFYYRHNPDGVFTYTSSSVEDILGYTPTEFQQHFEQFLPDTPLNQAAIAHTEGSIRGEQQPIYEIEVFHKDGSTRRVEVFERPIVDEQGEVIAVEGMSCDITNRIAEAERFSSLLESAPDGMVIVNEQGEITLINARIEELFGYSRDELIGQSIEKLVPQTQRASHVELREAFAEETKINHMSIGNEVMGLRSDGSQFPIEVNLGTIKVDDGILISASVRDITERQREEERFRTVFNTSRDAYFFQNEFSFIDCNESTVRMFGFDDKSEIIGLSPAAVSPQFQPDGTSSEQRARESTAIAKEKGFYQFEWMCKKRNGELLPLEVTLSPVTLDGQPVIFVVAHDLTERKKAEQALLEGEAYRSAILESSLDCLISMDHEGNIIEFNPAAEKTFGYKRDEIIGRTLSETVVPPAYREAHEQGLKHYLSTKEGPVLNQRIEITAMRADGTEFPVELAIIPIERGETPVFTAFIRDITERREAEEALAESENRLTLAMDTSGVGLWDFNTQTGDTFLSKEYLSMLGYEHNELAHGYDTWKMLLHPDEREVVTEKFGHFITSGKGRAIYEDEYRMVTKVGDVRWILARGGAVEFDENNNPVRMIGTHVDITERKQSQDTLSRLVEQQNVTLEISRAVQRIRSKEDLNDVLRTCHEQLQKLKLNFRSLAIHRLMDAEKKRFESHAIMDGKAFEQLTRILDSIYDMWQSGQPSYRNNLSVVRNSMDKKSYGNLSRRQGFEIRSILEVPHSRGTFSLMSDQDDAFAKEDIQFVQTVADVISLGIMRIDDLDQVERRNRQLSQARDEAEQAARDAEAANQAKSIFLANMSHEIRTPMNAILGFSQILEGIVHEPQQKEYLDSIQSSGKSLLTLINDILDLSKVEAGKLDLEFDATDARAVFNDMAQVFSQKVEEKNLDFVVDISPELPDALVLDEARLRQVLINIVGNAVKFTDKGHVKVSVNSDSVDDQHCNMTVDIEDTGIGIPEDQQDKIFGSFAQREGQSINEYGGTGLGLAITKQLVELMNGQIIVSSQVGVGSVFRVRLNQVEIVPAAALNARTTVIDVDAISFSPATILITDDIATNRDLIKGYLQSYNLTLIEAEDGHAAIEAIRQHRPALTLMDIKMPVLDGFTATKMIRHDAELGESVIVALTASAMRETEAEIGQICDGFIKKPVDKETLIAELARHLDHTFEVVEEVEQSSELSSIVELSPEVIAQLPELITQLEGRQDECASLAQTLAINEIDSFASELKNLGDAKGYYPLSQWADQLILQSSTFDMDGIVQTLNAYADVIAEAQTLTAGSDLSSNGSPTDFQALYRALIEQTHVWESVSQTLTINEVEDFAAYMQDLSQTHNYYPLIEWSEQLALQASTFDMDGMSKTLESYTVLVEQIQEQIKT